jgi:hypothetical protein
MSRDENSGKNFGTRNQGHDKPNSAPDCHWLNDYSALDKHFPRHWQQLLPRRDHENPLTLGLRIRSSFFHLAVTHNETVEEEIGYKCGNGTNDQGPCHIGPEVGL